MIDDNKKYIFVENPKTATYSIKHALMGKDNIHNPLDPRMGSINHKIPERIRAQFPEKWQSYTTFVVVRNTWDRAYSFFEFYRTIANSQSYQSLSFDEWVATGCPPPAEDHLRAPMHGEGRFDDTLCQLHYVEDVDEVIVLRSFDHQKRAQELQSGINRICRLLGLSLEPIPIDMNHYGRTRCSVFWKQETIDLLGESYKHEIERFGFLEPVLSMKQNSTTTG